MKKTHHHYSNKANIYLKYSIYNESSPVSFTPELVTIGIDSDKKVINFALNNFDFFKKSRINTILLDTKDKKSLGTPEIFSDDFFENFIMSAKIQKINIGLAGKIKIMDLNRLLKLKPNLIGIRGAACILNERESSISIRLVKKINGYFTEEIKNAQDVAGA